MRNYPAIGVQVPDVLLPSPGVDLTRWAVIACDQYTSQPDYWEQVACIIGELPSTLHLILPEIYLDGPDMDGRTLQIHDQMWRYLSGNLLQPLDGMVYVERRVDGKLRRGLVLALDLEHYDYRPGSQTLIRATEGTIVERIHPRMRIRDGAMLELPHILVLIDDPERSVIEPVSQHCQALRRLYDFDLMMNGGHLTGYAVDDLALEQTTMGALERLADAQSFAEKYDLPAGTPVLLFAMGDGNHSLATAKAIWEKIKRRVGPDHPARYALVEIENIHDEALAFEPIHRVAFNLQQDVLPALQDFFKGQCTYRPHASCETMIAQVNATPSPRQAFGLILPEGCGVVELAAPPATLTVGSLQAFLDPFMQARHAEKLDYVHGSDVVCTLGSRPGNAGFYLPAIAKGDLFRTVILDGVLPRKAFSMGEAHEKRFYMECRRIE
ncbi:MAG: DUF1015 domain-containing protein [Chloroflexota bacterium]